MASERRLSTNGQTSDDIHGTNQGCAADDGLARETCWPKKKHMRVPRGAMTGRYDPWRASYRGGGTHAV